MSKLGRLWAVGIAVVAAGLVSAAEDKKAELKVGDKAPAFTAMDDAGNEWKSSDHVGKKIVVVYFYPADCTGGCTNQALGFRNDMKKIKAKGVEVVGVSGDSVKNHQVFKKFHKLNFTLLADEDGTVAKLFGVPVGNGGTVTAKDQKGQPITDADGNPIALKRGATAKRWTFIIAKDGTVSYKNTNVNAGKDSKQVLEILDKSDK